jgi:outer membrane protein
MMKFLWPVLLSGLSFGAVAQTTASDDESPDGPPRGWQLGVATLVSDSPYAGEGTRVIPVPLVTYQGERFYFRGITAGWTILGLEGLELTAIAKLRMDGFTIDDLGRVELARNGLDYRLLEDRDDGLDAGLGMKWSGAAGELEVELLTDVTDTSGGQELSIQYGYPFELGKATVTPNVGATWMSEDMASYYYGTLDEEVARGVVDYKLDALAIPHIGVSFFRPLGEKWSVMGDVKYSRLPDEIKNSPFVEPDTSGTVSLFIGFSRQF